MKLTMLGTGNAMVTDLYNTCFLIDDDGKYLLVDGGGGNTIFSKLKAAGTDRNHIHEIFVTHKHLDHIMGVIWMVRAICQGMCQEEYEGEAHIYAHEEVISILRDFCSKVMTPKQAACLDSRLHLVVVADGETRIINGRKITFFDIQSTKAKQFGFTMELDDGKLTCCGDEPYNPYEEPYAKGSKWLMLEAFCLYGQADIFHPYEKHHSTVREACQLAEDLQVENVILYHTEEKTGSRRKELYTAEGKQYYHGNLFVPDEMESFEL